MQLLRAQEGELVRSKRQAAAAEAAVAEGGEQAAALGALLGSLRRLRLELSGEGAEGLTESAERLLGSEQAAAQEEAGDGASSGQLLLQEQGQAFPAADGAGGGRLAAAAGHVVSLLRAVATEKATAAAAVAARRDKSVQSDDLIAGEWREFVCALCGDGASVGGGGAPPALRHPLQLKACTEAVVRVYLRALRELEDLVVAREEQLGRDAGRQQRAQQLQPGVLAQGRPAAGGGGEAAGIGGNGGGSRPASAAASGGGGGDFGAGVACPASSLFDVLVAHYSQDGGGGGGDHAAWRDPEVGLVSERHCMHVTELTGALSACC